MAKQTINIGSSANKGDGDPLRTAFTKVNENFDELYTNSITQEELDAAVLGIVTGDIDLTPYALIDSLATVATSGDYTDLTNPPTIPTDVSDLTDTEGLLVHTSLEGYATEAYVDDAIAAIPEVDLSGYVTQADLVAGTITVDVNNTGDLTGSVFADNSTLLVDGVNSKIVGDIETDSLVVNEAGFVNFNGANMLNGGTVEAQLLLAGNIGVTGDVELLGGGIRSENAINIDINLSDSTLRRWTFTEGGDLQFPDGTTQSTAFLGGSPTQLANGDYSVVLDEAGELTVPGFIHLQYSGVTQGSIGTGPAGFSLVGEEDKTFGILLAPAGSPPVDWTFSTDGGLRFPDGTTQTTAYVANPGEPLFVVINSDGTNARSSDGTTWTQNDQLVVEGYSFERVAIANSYIVYVLGGPVPGALAYATTYGVTPTEVTFSTTGTEYYSWVDLQYADGYTVAVGAFYGDDGEGGNLPSVPVWAYTTNGSSWTIGNTDPLYQDGYPNGSFQSIDYGAGGWFFVASAEDTEPGNGAAGFFTTSLSSQLTLDNYIQFGDSLEGYWPNIASVVWDGSRWWVNDQDNANMYVSSGSNPLTSTWTTVSLETVAIDAGFGDTGPDFYEDAGGQINGTSWFVIANNEGQVLASNDGGETWIGSVPLAYTDTLATAIQASPARVTFTNYNPAGQAEKIVISNAVPSDWNGTYYVQNNLGNYELYTDVGITTPLDSSFFGALESADVLWSHGQYIDSVGFGLETFLVGNDDEQLFTSTDLTTWTKVDDLNDTFAYWNDFSFNATWGATGSNADRLVSGGASLLLGSDGNVTFPNDLSIQNFNTESVLFKSGDTFGIAGDSNAYLAWQNYAPGQGPGKQSVVDASDRGVTFYVDDATIATTYVWEFTNDGTTYLASNSSSPISYLQTPNNNTDIGLYIGAGDGVTIAANNYTSSVQWDFTPQGRLQFPGLANYSIGETEGGIQISSEAGVVISVDTSGTEKYFIVYDDGKVRLPGATISQPAEPTPGLFINANDMLLEVTAVDEAGVVTEITVTNSPNAAWNAGTYPGYTTGDITFTITIDGSGNATVSNISSGTGHSLSETWNINGTDFGAPAGTPTTLDVTKQTQVLGSVLNTSGDYILPDGTDGQIMYFVPASGVSGTIYVQVANARIYNDPDLEDVTEYSWVPFGGETLAPTTIAMAIFADGAWCLRGGVSD